MGGINLVVTCINFISSASGLFLSINLTKLTLLITRAYHNPNIIFNRLQSTLKDIIVTSIHSHPVLVSLSDQLKLQAKDSNRKVKEVSSLFP